MVAPFRLDALVPTGGSRSDPRGRKPAAQSRPRSRRRRKGRARLVLLLIVMVLTVAALAAELRLNAPEPVATVKTTMPSSFAVDSPPVVLPWALTGQSAIAVPAIGIDVTSGPETPVPVASLTKMMTGYVVLHDHPLLPGQDGPRITMTPTDVSYFDVDTVEDQANAQVAVGEVLTERQLLEGLLVHSANNFADTLARWDAGSIAAFVAEMNRTAAQLGMTHTHYADPSGFDAGSQSTAGDLLKVAMPDMMNPTFAGIVHMSSVTLPVAGTISTYTPLLGFQGVIGVKSGFTTAAGGCDVVAVVRRVHGEAVLILSAVTGQTGPNVLVDAGFIALNLANHVASAIGATSVVHRGEVVAHFTVSGHTVAAEAAGAADFLSWPGLRAATLLVASRPISAGTLRGTRVGSVVAVLGAQRVVIPVVLHQYLPKPSVLQRLM
jgi:D-alanyl-D-alanine carboxypeptidase (penicillin-binding protein 5/6)